MNSHPEAHASLLLLYLFTRKITRNRSLITLTCSTDLRFRSRLFLFFFFSLFTCLFLRFSFVFSENSISSFYLPFFPLLPSSSNFLNRLFLNPFSSNTPIISCQLPLQELQRSHLSRKRLSQDFISVFLTFKLCENFCSLERYSDVDFKSPFLSFILNIIITL